MLREDTIVLCNDPVLHATLTSVGYSQRGYAREAVTLEYALLQNTRLILFDGRRSSVAALRKQQRVLVFRDRPVPIGHGIVVPTVVRETSPFRKERRDESYPCRMAHLVGLGTAGAGPVSSGNSRT